MLNLILFFVFVFAVLVIHDQKKKKKIKNAKTAYFLVNVFWFVVMIKSLVAFVVRIVVAIIF